MCAYFVGESPPTTSVNLTLTIENFTSFNLTSLTNSLAVAAGINASKVEIISVEYVVSVQYTFAAGTSITEVQAKAAIATASGVPESYVTVSVDGLRRLQSSIRRLAVVVAGDITTTDPAVAQSASVAAENATSFAQTVRTVTQDTTIAVPSVSISRKVVMKTQLRAAAVGDKPVSAPSSSVLQTAFEDALGATITLTVDAEMYPTPAPPTAPPTIAPTAPIEDAPGGVTDFGCRSSTPTAIMFILISFLLMDKYA